MNKHPMADLMMLYAQDAQETESPWERWQLRQRGCAIWKDMASNPVWANLYEYRKRPRTININGFEVPIPFYGEFDSFLDRYWLVSFDDDGPKSYPVMGCAEILRNARIKGLLHTTKEAAQAHIDALLSFTK